MTLVDKLRDKLKAREQATADGYADAVNKAAAGKTLDVDALAGLLDAAGRTADRFAADVAERAERDRLRGVAGQMPKLEAELADLNRRSDALVKERDAALLAFADKLAPLDGRRAAVEQEMTAARTAARRLRDGVPADHPARQVLAAAEARSRDAHGRVLAAEGLIGQAKTNQWTVEENPHKYGNPDEAKLVRGRLDKYIADRDAAAADRAAAQAEVERLFAALVEA